MQRMSGTSPRRPDGMGTARQPSDLIQVLEADRAQLWNLARTMLGNPSEADDIVQEVYLRVHRLGGRTVEAPRAYLYAITRRLCLDLLTAPRTVREQPLEAQSQATTLGESADSPMEAAMQHEAVSGALWLVLAHLNPQERAVFLLRESFAYTYEEIAALIHMSAANCRQLLHRAHRHLAAGQERFAPAPAEHARMVEQFLAASQRGELAPLAARLARDAERSPRS